MKNIIIKKKFKKNTLLGDVIKAIEKLVGDSEKPSK